MSNDQPSYQHTQLPVSPDSVIMRSVITKTCPKDVEKPKPQLLQQKTIKTKAKAAQSDSTQAIVKEENDTQSDLTSTTQDEDKTIG